MFIFFLNHRVNLFHTDILGAGGFGDGGIDDGSTGWHTSLASLLSSSEISSLICLISNILAAFSSSRSDSALQ